MSTLFKNKLATGLGTATTPLFQTNSSATTTIIGLSLTNITSGIIQASIQLQDTNAGTTAYYIQNVTIPSNTSMRVVTGGEKLVLGGATNVIVYSNTSSSMDLVASWVEIS
jgi:hypothetical protein